MKTIRIGIFGLGRGSAYIDNFLANNAEIVAVCEKSSEKTEKVRKKLGNSVAYYEDFDSFINHPMDAVFLANYFHEHTKYAIACLEKNIHVLSECTSNATMAEGVALVRAAEKSKAFYMLAENYPYMIFNQEMRRVFESGTLGKLMFAEGEYNHPGNIYSTESKHDLYDSEIHWRHFLPQTYYITHSLAPLVCATGALPIRVSAFPIIKPRPKDCVSIKRTAEKTAIITCLNNDGSVYRVTGCAAFGGHENSYRLCGEKGQIENVRGTDGMIMLSYNSWQMPEGMEEHNYYKAEIKDKDEELIKKAGHGGGDFFVARVFLDCIRKNKRPEMDEYFATRLASVAILSHRSMLENGVPYDIPDFKKEEDRKKYENDTLSPFWYSDGTPPSMPCTSVKGYEPSELQFENYRKAMAKS